MNRGDEAKGVIELLALAATGILMTGGIVAIKIARKLKKGLGGFR